MRKAIYSRVLLSSIIFLLIVIPFLSFSQCLGPTTNTNAYPVLGSSPIGQRPADNGNYFVNHEFSTFTSTLGLPTGGSLNGNNFTIGVTGVPTTHIVSTDAPGESVVSGSGFPSSTPQAEKVSAVLGVKITHTFTTALPIGTHVYLQDVDQKEAWTIQFRNATNNLITATSFTPFNLSTTGLPTLARPTTTTIKFTGPAPGNDEPLVGIIITVATVKTIEFTVATGATTNAEIFYSVPLMPSFTASSSSNTPLCSGNALNLTGSTSSLQSTVPTPLVYIWSGPNSYYDSSTNNPSTLSSATTSAAGSYSLKIKDAFGCFTTTAVSTAVTINQSPTVTASSNTPVSYGSNINLSAAVTGVTSPTFNWSGPNSFTSTTQNSSVSSATSANAGVYTLKATGSNGCSSTVTAYVQVKSGWIYIHNKSIKEESSTDFTFTLKDNSTNSLLKTFVTKDQASNYLNMYDLGAGKDNGAGDLWVIAGATQGTSNTGTVYRRVSGSSQWTSTSIITATAIDGAGLNQFVYVNSSGDAYYYNAGSSTLIFNHTTSHNGQTASASDIAYGGGKIAIRNANGRVYLYTGDYTNDSWTDISANTNIADRIDINTDGSKIVYILNAAVKVYTLASATTTTLPAFTTTSGAGASGTRDITIDDDGTIYATGNTGTTTCCGNTDIIYSLTDNASTWTAEPEARGVVRLTAGPGGQAWGGVNLGTNFPQTLYTRVTDNTGIHLWLDDERVQSSSSTYGNSIMMEVASGEYKVEETLPDATWDVGRYNIYDPTGNSTGNVSTNTTTIRPANGEVVHVEYINEKLNIKTIDNANCNTSILQSFDAGAATNQFGSGTYGTGLEGTAYHYFSQVDPQDGYYNIVKSLSTWFGSSSVVSDHSGNSGYFLIVNASYAKDEFYRQRITGLTQNLTYRIAFYVTNISASSPIKPKLRFGMQTLSGAIFGDSTTEEVTSTGWVRYSVSFTVPSGVTTADLFLRNENIGGLGNDLAIDDIAINPIPTPLVTNVIAPATNNLCVGSSYAISNTVSGGTWSISDPSIATVNSTTGVITVKAVGAAKITYTYINNIFCQSTASNDVTVSVPPTAAVAVSSSDVCKGTTTTLSANPTGGTGPYQYAWTATYGTLSSTAVKQPVLTPSTLAGSYLYNVKVTDAMGCTSSAATATVNVHAPAASINSLCVTNAPSPYAQLLEASTGVSWLWSSTTDSALFYANSNYINGTSTSTVQSPYVNFIGSYKVVITDPYTCKDSATYMFDHSSCILLPVTLSDFSATLKGNVVLLNWVTSSESNTKYFTVERSNNMNVWKEIGSVNAAGYSVEKKNYFFTDALPLTGDNYYRLKQVDADGKFSYSIIRVVKTNDVWSVKIYPNPVVNNALQLESNKRVLAIKITDINGKLLLNKNPSDNSYKINLTGFAGGFYIMQLVNETGEIKNAPFIKK